MTTCHGNGLAVCCFVPGQSHPIFGEGVCPLLEVGTVEGRHWACGAFRVHGSWEAAHASPEYQELVAPAWRLNDPPVADCGDWRVEGQCCYGDNPPVLADVPVTLDVIVRGMAG